MKKYQRLRFILLFVVCLALSIGIALYAMKENLSYFLTPSDVHKLRAASAPQVEDGRAFRLGGMVKERSLRARKKNLAVRFIVTDFEKNIAVEYKGILPDLFREGQGVVAKGSLNAKGFFVADELLAKHDEKYMPPEIAKKMKKKK